MEKLQKALERERDEKRFLPSSDQNPKPEVERVSIYSSTLSSDLLFSPLIQFANFGYCFYLMYILTETGE